jgi:hypothetical protein
MSRLPQSAGKRPVLLYMNNIHRDYSHSISHTPFCSPDSKTVFHRLLPGPLRILVRNENRLLLSLPFDPVLTENIFFAHQSFA